MLQRATSRALLSVHRACVSARIASSRRAAAQVPHARRRVASSVVAMATPKIGKDGERVWPEEGKVEVDGKFYRRCAAALVFNTNGDVLVGERTDRPGSWGMPQGGIEMDESAEAAASRELYEEVGMRVGTTPGLAEVASIPADDTFCYAAGGWLAKKGLAGQRLEFTLFHLPTDEDPGKFCNLDGLGGEKPEFSRVRWAPMEEVVEAVWESKRGPYERCMELGTPIIEAHLGKIGGG